MHLRYSYRVCPTVGQRQALARTFGCARVVYNDALAPRKAAWKADRSRIPTGAPAKSVITDAKKTDARSWLGSVSVDALQSSIRDLDTAYRNFFDSLSGKRAGRPVGLPRFKSRKDNRQSLRFSRNGFRIRGNGKLNLAKIGGVRVKWSRALPADPSSVTIVLDPSGRYFASFVVDIESDHLAELDTEIGIDLGLTTYAVMKAARYGRHVGIIGRYEPTSQVCSTCGVLDGPKPLNIRTWTCGACGTCHDRDLNAARNILAAGRADRLNACGGPVGPSVAIPRRARPVETGTHRNAGGTGRKPRAAGAAGTPVP
ncbi:RNA-guided endonuclease InsQ/TnpB family protein [Kitasatospora sp. NPDC003701]